MALWRLRRPKRQYDRYAEFLVRASTEEEARRLASDHVLATWSADGMQPTEWDRQEAALWLDQDATTAEPVPDGGPAVLCSVFRHG